MVILSYETLGKPISLLQNKIEFTEGNAWKG